MRGRKPSFRANQRVVREHKLRYTIPDCSEESDGLGGVAQSSVEPLRVILAQPRGFCAGVVRAIETVERALKSDDGPVYVRHEIVHNRHVVQRLQSMGAHFVEELDEIPEGSVTIFSAHGVPHSVEQSAKLRSLRVQNATCPLVTKVHAQCRRYVELGRTIVLIGHAGHPEVVGTMGQISAPVHLITTRNDIDQLQMPSNTPIAYVTQTTLSVDDTRELIETLRGKFPDCVGPETRDICYATQNRQHAVRDLCKLVDALLVIGAKNSSNSNRLYEIGSEIVPTYFVVDPEDIETGWFNSISSVGITAGASAPEELVTAVVARMASFRSLEISTLPGRQETIRFQLPRTISPG